MLNNIINGQKVKKKFIKQKKTKQCIQLLNILWDEGYILGYKILNKNILIFLKYKQKKAVINNIHFITKPKKRVYCTVKELWKINTNHSLLILSTNNGFLPLKVAKQLHLGGELFCILK